MIGKLTYDQLDELTEKLSTSNTNLRSSLEFYNTDSDLASKTNKLLQFSNELEKYINNLKSIISLNKDADIVINRLKEQ